MLLIFPTSPLHNSIEISVFESSFKELSESQVCLKTLFLSSKTAESMTVIPALPYLL
jgi:hypothetical protein